MVDEKSRSERLQQAVRELSEMTPEEKTRWLAECQLEIRYADGWSSQFYKNYVEADEYV